MGQILGSFVLFGYNFANQMDDLCTVDILVVLLTVIVLVNSVIALLASVLTLATTMHLMRAVRRQSTIIDSLIATVREMGKLIEHLKGQIELSFWRS